jgi:hypothetical protein
VLLLRAPGFKSALEDPIRTSVKITDYSKVVVEAFVKSLYGLSDWKNLDYLGLQDLCCMALKYGADKELKRFEHHMYRLLNPVNCIEVFRFAEAHSLKSLMWFAALGECHHREANDVCSAEMARLREGIPFQCRIFYKNLTGNTRALDVVRFLSVLEVKLMISCIEGIPTETQRLIFAGAQLEDARQLYDYNVQRDITLDLVLRLRGC